MFFLMGNFVGEQVNLVALNFLPADRASFGQGGQGCREKDQNQQPVKRKVSPAEMIATKRKRPERSAHSVHTTNLPWHRLLLRLCLQQWPLRPPRPRRNRLRDCAAPSCLPAARRDKTI